MNTEKDKPTTETQAVIEQLQSDIEALKTQLFFLTDTKIEHTNAQLQLTQTELEATKQKLQNTQNYIDETLIGSVAAFAMTTPPEGWLECNGQAVSRTEYAKLFNKIGTTFGAGDDETTFNLPDLRGVFVRGWEKFEGGHDSGREFGAYQDDQMQSHTHQDSGHNHLGNISNGGSHSHKAGTDSAGNHSHSGNTSNNGYHNHYLNKRKGNRLRKDDEFRATGYYKNYRFQGNEPKQRILSSFGSLSGEEVWSWADCYSGSVGTTDSDGSHTHSFSTNSASSHSHNVNVDSAGSHSHTVSINNGQAKLSNPTNARHGKETHPKNVALLFCIKY